MRRLEKLEVSIWPLRQGKRRYVPLARMFGAVFSLFSILIVWRQDQWIGHGRICVDFLLATNTFVNRLGGDGTTSVDEHQHPNRKGQLHVVALEQANLYSAALKPEILTASCQRLASLRIKFRNSVGVKGKGSKSLSRHLSMMTCDFKTLANSA